MKKENIKEAIESVKSIIKIYETGFVMSEAKGEALTISYKMMSENVKVLKDVVLPLLKEKEEKKIKKRNQ